MSKDRNPRRRPAKKSHSKAPRRSRLRWFRRLFYVLPIILVAAGTYGLLHSPALAVQQVRVEGAQTLDRAALVEISGLQGASMLRLPLSKARQRLSAIPDVASVSFSRDWPRTVTVRIDEREPVAFWSVSGRDYVVDAEGVVLSAGAPGGPAPRIVEVGNERTLKSGDRVHPDAIALARRILHESPRFLGQTVELLEYRSEVGVTAVFRDGMRVTFGDERSYEYKVAVLAQLIDKLSVQGKTPRAVDLRFGERVTYE